MSIFFNKGECTYEYLIGEVLQTGLGSHIKFIRKPKSEQKHQDQSRLIFYVSYKHLTR